MIMPQSYYRIILHAVFSTKDREALLFDKNSRKVYRFIEDELKLADCIPLAIGGMPDHVHILYLQNPKVSVSETIRKVKGKSSFLINEKPLLPIHFAWQSGYSIFSVSESQLYKTIEYVKSQKKHHADVTFEEEHEILMKLHKLKQ